LAHFDDPTVLRLALAAALRRLPKRQREVIALRYLTDLCEADVALALGIAPATVRTHVHRALVHLRSRLGTPSRRMTLSSTKPNEPSRELLARVVCRGEQLRFRRRMAGGISLVAVAVLAAGVPMLLAGGVSKSPTQGRLGVAEQSSR
jgi:DNA-binding CsgD family transcriptional regulator